MDKNLKQIEEQMNSPENEGQKLLDGVNSKVPECYDVDIFDDLDNMIQNEQEG